MLFFQLDLLQVSPNLLITPEIEKIVTTTHFIKLEKFKKSLKIFHDDLRKLLQSHQNLMLNDLDLYQTVTEYIKIASNKDISYNTENSSDCKKIEETNQFCEQFQAQEINNKENVIIESKIINEDSIHEQSKEVSKIPNVQEDILSLDIVSDNEYLEQKCLLTPEKLSPKKENSLRSPIISRSLKRKRNSSKKNNTSSSNTSDSGNLDDNRDIGDLSIHFEDSTGLQNDDSVKIIENTPPEFESQNQSNVKKSLVFSKINNTKSSDSKSKKYKQTTLQLKPSVQKIDISKFKRDDNNSAKSNEEKRNNIGNKNILEKSENLVEDNLNADLMQEDNEENFVDLINASINPEKKNVSKLRSKLMLRKSELKNNANISKANKGILFKKCLKPNDDCGLLQNPKVEVVSYVEEENDNQNLPPQVTKSQNGESFDETHFSPIPKKNGIDNYDISGMEINSEDFEEEMECAAPQNKKIMQDSYDIVPNRTQKIPNFACKGPTVRKKNERALLNGYDCRDCAAFYNIMETSTEKRQEMIKRCSRHRGYFNENQDTPESFWNPDFSETMSSTFNN